MALPPFFITINLAVFLEGRNLDLPPGAFMTAGMYLGQCIITCLITLDDVFPGLGALLVFSFLHAACNSSL